MPARREPIPQRDGISAVSRLFRAPRGRRACRRRRARRGRRTGRAAARRHAGPRPGRRPSGSARGGAGAPRAAVRRGDHVAALLRASSRSRGRSRPARRRGPSASTTTAASTSAASPARPQRSEAPGPRSHSAQGTRRASTLQHTVAKSVCPLDHDDLVDGARHQATEHLREELRCFGAPKRVAAPAASTTAAMRLTAAEPAVTESITTGWCRLLGRRVAQLPDALDDVEAARHRADDRVLGREPRIDAGHDEELAAGGARRLGRGLGHRDDALRVRGVRGRRVAGRVAGTAAARLGRVAALDRGSPARSGGRRCRRSSRHARARRATPRCSARSRDRA